MRILYLHDYADRAGGAEFQLDTLRRGMEALGHETSLVASDVPLSASPDFAPGTICKGATGRAQVLRQAVNPSAARAVSDAVRAFRPDVVHIRMFLWQLSPLVLRALKDVPVVYQAAVYKAVCPNGRRLLPTGETCPHKPGLVCHTEGCLTWPTWLALMAQRRLLSAYADRIDRTVTLSRRMAAVMEGVGWPVHAVIPNGVEPAPARPPLTGPPEIGYAGRLDKEKGIDTLFEAAARLAERHPDLRLTLLGDGPSRPALEDQARTLGLDARFLGRQPRPEMERALSAAWVQAVPSVWEEPFGNVTTEAMMRGTAAVASAVGGQAEIVDDGVTGRLVPPRDVEALTQALASYLADRDLAEAHGAAGRARAIATYRNDVVRDAYAALYAALIEDYAERPG